MNVLLSLNKVKHRIATLLFIFSIGFLYHNNKFKYFLTFISNKLIIAFAPQASCGERDEDGFLREIYEVIQ